MTAQTVEVLAHDLLARGVTLARNADRLRYSAPPGALNAAMLEEVRAHKAELLAWLAAPAATAPAAAEAEELAAARRRILPGVWARLDGDAERLELARALWQLDAGEAATRCNGI